MRYLIPVIGILLTLTVLQVGCGLPWVQPSEFLDLASDFALNPGATCDELKVSFGVPHLTVVDLPSEAGMGYEEVYLTNPGGYPLRVWYIPSEIDRGVIVISNGAVGNMACFLFLAHMLRADGWSVVLYDFQGFGGSAGTASLASLYGDLDVVLDWTLERTEREQVTLLGVSVGTIPSVAHAYYRAGDVNAVVLDGPISLLAEAMPFAGILGNNPQAYLNRESDTLQLRLLINDLTQPTLVFLYGLDEFETAHVFEDLVANTTTPLTIIKWEALPHARGPYLETATYFFQLDRFLANVWASD